MPRSDEPTVGRVEVTWVDMDATGTPVADYWQTLGLDERARARGFRSPRDQRRFIIRRGALRAILASHLGCAASRIRYSQNRFGKLAVVDSDIRFSVSRSHEVALFALTRGVEIGCDIERVDPRFEFEEIATRLFAPQELAELHALPPALRCATFFRQWTLKEAYVKCRGVGLSVPLDSIVVSPVENVCAVPQGGADGVLFASFEPVSGYLAALVVEATWVLLRLGRGGEC